MQRFQTTRTLLCVAHGCLIAFAALGLAACGVGGGAPSDPEQGRKVLQTALDAWKGGEAPAALASRTPAIHVTDGDWASGLRLESYAAEGGGKLVGSDVNYDVVLTLKTPRGRVVRNAVYAVTTHPQVLVHRQDSL